MSYVRRGLVFRSRCDWLVHDYLRPGKFVYHHQDDGWFFGGVERRAIKWPSRTPWPLRLWGVRHARWAIAKALAVTETEHMRCHGIERGWL